MAAEAGFDNPMYGTLALQEVYHVVAFSITVHFSGSGKALGLVCMCVWTITFERNGP